MTKYGSIVATITWLAANVLFDVSFHKQNQFPFMGTNDKKKVVIAWFISNSAFNAFTFNTNSANRYSS